MAERTQKQLGRQSFGQILRALKSRAGLVIWKTKPHPFWQLRPLLALALTSVVLILITDRLSALWLFRYPNILSNEALASLSPPRAATKVVLVSVDQSDFDSYFGGSSPLSATSLRNAICAILQRNPRVLLIDFDTSDARFRNLRLPPTSTRLVFARGAKRFRGSLVIGKVLGEASSDVAQGFAVGAVDEDGTVRRFPREIRLDGKWFYTLHWRATREYLGDDRETGSGVDGSFEKRFPDLEVPQMAVNYEIPVFYLRSLAPTSESCIQPVPDGKLDLSTKVAILAGTYDYADTHATPFGDKWGGEVLASAIEMELSNKERHHIPTGFKYGVKGFLALLIAWLFNRMYAIPATIAVLFGLIPMILFGNIFAALVLGYEGMVVPFVIGILIEQLVTVTHEAHHSQHSSRGPELP